MNLDDFLRDADEDRIQAMIMACEAELDRRRFCQATTAGGSGELMRKVLLARGLISEAAATWGVTEADICGPGKTTRIVEARRHVMWALREKGWSLPRIGRELNRDHTTVMHNLNAMKKQMGAAQ